MAHPYFEQHQLEQTAESDSAQRLPTELVAWAADQVAISFNVERSLAATQAELVAWAANQVSISFDVERSLVSAAQVSLPKGADGITVLAPTESAALFDVNRGPPLDSVVAEAAESQESKGQQSIEIADATAGKESREEQHSDAESWESAESSMVSEVDADQTIIAEVSPGSGELLASAPGGSGGLGGSSG
ncbi:MAG: hypothetical protein ACK5FQ_06085, partial [Betaproteobacteria bacterium]